MSQSLFSRVTRRFVGLAVFCLTIATAVPAFASSEDTTDDVIVMNTQHEWYYWPGWAFLALALLVLALVVFFWVKLLIMPKYRGRKVVS